MQKIPTIFILIASAGHGKDYVKSIIEENINKKAEEIKFAEKAKEIIATSLKSEFINNDMSIEEKIEVLNDLKDNHMQTKVLGEENMRKMLQVLLGDVIRDINPDIHALFALKSIEEKLLENDKPLLICTDNRYVNEQELMYPINLLDSKEEQIDYIRWAIDYNQTTKDTNGILEKFDELTKPYIKDSKDQSMINKIKMKFVRENDKLKNTTKSKLDYYEFTISIDFEKIKEMTKEESLENGIVNIFRPLLPLNDSYSELSKEELISEIANFNNSSIEDIQKIAKNYELFDLKFNYENVKKYGYLRANPNHYSETALNERKPEAFINYPESYEQNIKSDMRAFFFQPKETNKKVIRNKIN